MAVGVIRAPSRLRLPPVQHWGGRDPGEATRLTELQASGLQRRLYVATGIGRYLESGLAMSRMRLPAGQGDKSPLADFRRIFNMIPHHGETRSSTPRAFGESVKQARAAPCLARSRSRRRAPCSEDLVALVITWRF